MIADKIDLQQVWYLTYIKGGWKKEVHGVRIDKRGFWSERRYKSTSGTIGYMSEMVCGVKGGGGIKIEAKR